MVFADSPPQNNKTMHIDWNKYIRQTTPGRPQREWKSLAIQAYKEGKARPAYPAEMIRRKLRITWMRLIDLSRAGVLPLVRLRGIWMIPDIHVFAYFYPDEVWDGQIEYRPDLMPGGI